MGSPSIGYLGKVAPSSKSYGLRSNLLLKVRMYTCVLLSASIICCLAFRGLWSCLMWLPTLSWNWCCSWSMSSPGRPIPHYPLCHRVPNEALKLLRYTIFHLCLNAPWKAYGLCMPPISKPHHMRKPIFKTLPHATNFQNLTTCHMHKPYTSYGMFKRK